MLTGINDPCGPELLAQLTFGTIPGVARARSVTKLARQLSFGRRPPESNGIKVEVWSCDRKAAEQWTYLPDASPDSEGRDRLAPPRALRIYTPQSCPDRIEVVVVAAEEDKAFCDGRGVAAEACARREGEGPYLPAAVCVYRLQLRASAHVHLTAGYRWAGTVTACVARLG